MNWTPELERTFTYATLDEAQRSMCRDLFQEARRFALFIQTAIPESPEKARALASLQATLLWCDAAIAIHLKPETSSAR